MLEYKKAKYKELVEKRKACALCPLHNPSRIEGGKYDCDHLDPWGNLLENDLDAKIVILGKVWGSVEKFIKQKGQSNPKSPTSRNLIKLLHYIGIDPYKDKLFLTNAISCMTEEEQKLEESWFKNCSTTFLKPTLELIEPELVIALGKDAFLAITQLYGIDIEFGDAVKKRDPIYLTEHMKCFVVNNPVQFPLEQELHYEQWERIIPHLPDSYKK